MQINEIHNHKKTIAFILITFVRMISSNKKETNLVSWNNVKSHGIMSSQVELKFSALLKHANG